MNVGLASAAILCFSAAAAAQDMGAAAQNTAAAVTGQFGTVSGMNNGLAQPISTSGSMSTVDGTQQFTTQVSCPSSNAFLQLVMFPQSSGDIARLGISEDSNFDGHYDVSELLTGPYAAVCHNGVIHCDAGTFNNCTYWQWAATASTIGLKQVSIEDLGACYCINNSCGSGLVWTNSQKVLADLGTGIAIAMNGVYPRLTISQSTYPDPTTIVFYGNQAGCGSDSQPEQYYSNSSALQAAGVAAASNPNSNYYLVLNSPAGQSHNMGTQSCQRSRQFNITKVDKNQVLAVLSRSSGQTLDCGSGCLQFQLGAIGDNYWNSSSCSVFSDQEQIQVNGAQYVTFAELIDTEYDDWQQDFVNGQRVWSAPASWTDPTTTPSSSCETSRHGSTHPNLDLSSFFASDGVVTLKNRTAVGGGGEGWSVVELHVAEGCQIDSSYIDDGCTAEEANASCQLMSETVDGVPVVVNYVNTGLEPLPSTQVVSGPSCVVGPVTEPWWLDQRVYTCPMAQAPPYNTADAVAAYNSVRTTLDPVTGNYTARMVDPNTGVVTLVPSTIPLPPTQVEPVCFPTCETMQPNIGPSVGDQVGATSTLNTTGPPYVYTWKACTDAGVCPTDAGQTIAQPCDCHNNFGQAAATMQLIRMMGQDTICTTGP